MKILLNVLILTCTQTVLVPIALRYLRQVRDQQVQASTTAGYFFTAAGMRNVEIKS